MAPLLWNRIRTCPDDPEAGLLERCRDFSIAAGLDAEVARQWSLAREVENALSYAARPTMSHPRSFAVVASTLAGRTLAGCPRPTTCPEPGQEAAGRLTAAAAVIRPRTAAKAVRTASTAADVGVIRAPVADRDPQHVPALPARAGHPDPSVPMIRAVTARVVASSPKASETWV